MDSDSFQVIDRHEGLELFEVQCPDHFEVFEEIVIDQPSKRAKPAPRSIGSKAVGSLDARIVVVRSIQSDSST